MNRNQNNKIHNRQTKKNMIENRRKTIEKKLSIFKTVHSLQEQKQHQRNTPSSTRLKPAKY